MAAADTVRMELPIPLDVSVTLVGLKDAAGRGLLVALETVADRVTVPEKPLLVRVIMEVPSEPSRIFRDVGFGVMLKVGGERVRVIVAM